MFKKRSLVPGGTKQNKRKKIEHCKGNFEPKSADAGITDAPLTKQRTMMGHMQTSGAKLAKANTDDECANTDGDDDGDKAKFTLSVNDDVTKEDRLNAESKLEDANDTKIPDSTVPFGIKDRSTQTSKQIRQPSNIRTTMLTDYQPDICKDYKQTGYCGYGDSCKFLHSRDDFKAGWKLNQEWKIESDSDKNPDVVVNLKNVPPNCSICKEGYKSPVITSCGHYFCSKCFTKRVRENPKCVVCGQDTHGVAKMATHLKRNLTKKSLQ